MPITLALVATIVREADNTPANERVPFVVDGDRVLITARRVALPANELWRSDDRGVTWTFHDIGQSVNVNKNNLVKQGGFWWIYGVGAPADGFRRTPEGNPGAGGFVSTPMNFTSPHEGFDVATMGVVIKQAGANQNLQGPVTLAGEPPATPILGNTTETGGIVRAIPGAPVDVLGLTTSPRIQRLRTAPFSIVNATLLVGTDDSAFQPYPNLSGLSATDYWASTDRDVEPTRSWQTTNGGTSYTERNLAADFWGDVPGVIAAKRRAGHFAQFFRFGGVDYCFNRYLDTGGNPAQSGLHHRVARFDGSVWQRESNRIADGFPMIFAGAGVNAAGNADFYLTTYDAAADTTRVYRGTVLQPSPGGGILGGMSGRGYLGGRRPRRRGR